MSDNPTLDVSLRRVIAKVESHYGADLAMAVKCGCAVVGATHCKSARTASL
jgi:hypothetical protein